MATHFSLSPTGDKAKPIAPITIPENVNWGNPYVAVQGKAPAKEKAVVTYVDDGDGARLTRKDGSAVTCRIDTIDAPETAKPKYGKPDQAFGVEAREYLQKLIDKKEVTLTVTQEALPGPATKYNNYGRSLCKIEVEGKNIDQQMLQAGAAWLYRKYGQAVDPKLEEAEQRARLAKEGLWANPTAENPATFRARYPSPLN